MTTKEHYELWSVFTVIIGVAWLICIIVTLILKSKL